MATKLTLKNQLVYDYFRKHLHDEQADVKGVFTANKVEINRRFSINTYATFNQHIKRCRDWEAETGKQVEVINLNNKGVVDETNT